MVQGNSPLKIPRTIDKTKKSNIKCEHCKHYCKSAHYPTEIPTPYCTLLKQRKNYWNRCKRFEWAEYLPYRAYWVMLDRYGRIGELYRYKGCSNCGLPLEKSYLYNKCTNCHCFMIDKEKEK